MANPWDEIAGTVLAVTKESLKGFIENNSEVDEFAKQHAEDYAREWWGSRHADTEEIRTQHEENLKHLVAQVRGRARRLQISVSTEAKDTLGRILEAVGNVILKVGPKLLAAAL
jgi:hypothetical protein